MKHTPSRIASFACAAALTAIGTVGNADEAEIFVGLGSAAAPQRPNILFIIDTSGSMRTDVVTQVPFDPAVDWPGSCADDVVYFDNNGNANDPPDCNDDNSVPIANFKCNAGTVNMALAGYYLAPQAAQWRRSSSSATKRWRSIDGRNTADAWVECDSDHGVHGNGVNLSNLWAANSGGPWIGTENTFWSGFNSYVFYSGNYINWLRDPSNTTSQTRLEIVQQVATQTIAQLAIDDAVNVGLMQFSNNTDAGCSNTATSEGGMVLREMGPVAANAADLTTDIAALSADGCTPLSESMYEAYLYLSGGAVDYGNGSYKDPGTPWNSISSSRQGAPNTGIYQSPITVSCQRNFIVLLTDGIPTSDTSADPEIEGLIGGSCAGTGSGRCLEEIAEYMYTNDMRPTLDDGGAVQNVVTHTIGFGPEVSGSAALFNTADGGGGNFYEANDTASLSTVLTNIARDILAFNTSFTAPAVSVNAFNRTQNLNDLYVTVFRPTDTYFWNGNIKKYTIETDGVIKDASVPAQSAVDIASGFFRTNARSFWSADVDGDQVSLGGAANELPVPAARNVYTDVDPSLSITDPGNALTASNTDITDPILGLGAAGDPTGDDLINWLRGQDVNDSDGDSDTDDARFVMGDPMNGRPATVIYGGTLADPEPNDGVVYAVTNEGYLHAIDAQLGNELWAFMPAQLLARARDLYVDEPLAEREYGLDGNIRVVRNEVNNNGVIEPGEGENVRIYFGMRRGGREYYGLDVTDRYDPQLLFKIGPNEVAPKRLPGAGQSWSTPSLAKVNIDGASQNSLQQVLVFGGGYDTAQDTGAYSLDGEGNQIFMVDAVSGDLLWYAGPATDTGADLRHPTLLHSIPGDIRVFDLTGDGFADRMYAADMGGRVWRFDIHNGQTRTNLVTGGVFASLGNAHLGAHPTSTTRRFYSAPDVAFLSDEGRTWLNVALGSGYRGHPLNVETEDRFYSLRDHLPFARLTQAQYDAATVITEADPNLIDITSELEPDVPATGPGWRLSLRTPAGEKSLSEARTIQNMIQFTTYEPNLDVDDPVAGACAPDKGINRLYTISAFSGAPVFNQDGAVDPDGDDDGDGVPNGAEDDDGDGVPNSSDNDDDGDGIPDTNDPDSVDDRDTELAQGGIAPEVVWLFPSPDDPVNCVGEECRPDPVCLVGLENCGVGVNLNPVRTFWRQAGVN